MNRGIKPSSLSSTFSFVALISQISGWAAWIAQEEFFAMDYMQSIVELHSAENMVGRLSPTYFPDNFGSHAKMLHYI